MAGASSNIEVLGVLTRGVLILTFITGLANTGSAQRPCDVLASRNNPDRVDVTCNCMQKLTQMNLAIDRLVIEQESCPTTGLELSWAALETHVAPLSLTFVGAYVQFTRSDVATWNSSIEVLEFEDCNIPTIPSYAFEGLKRLKVVRIMNSVVDAVETGAFSDLDQVSVVEISDTRVATIEREAFANLPLLEDLALVRNFIVDIKSGAIVLPQTSTATTRCSAELRHIMDKEDILNELMGRELTSTDNLPLPEYGTRFLLFKNTIETVRSRAVVSESLGFLISGGNEFGILEPEAFTMELHNECEISAALFVGNSVDELQDRALAGLRGRDGASYQAFIALANNTFRDVAAGGFTLAPNLVIFAVEENRFACACDGFDWILSNVASENQRDLEKELVVKATCLDGTHLIAFTSTCTDQGSNSTTSGITTTGTLSNTTTSAITTTTTLNNTTTPITHDPTPTLPPRTTPRPYVITQNPASGSGHVTPLTYLSILSTLVICWSFT